MGIKLFGTDDSPPVPKYDTAALRIASFDIETASGFDGSYNRFLCACFKFNDEDFIRTVGAPKLKDEKKAMKKFSEWWNEADIVYGWNSKLFDRRFMNARLVRSELPMLGPKMHLDLLPIWKYNAKVASNKLMHVAKDLKCTEGKFDVEAEHWTRAADGDKESYKLIVKHCQHDVLLTEEVLYKMRDAGMIVRIMR